MFANRLFLPVVFILILSLGFGSFLIYLLETKREFESRAIATLIATSHAKSLEKQLSRSLSATYALAAILKQNNSIPNFDILAQDLIDRYGGITNLQLAPKAIVRQIFPLEGHQAAIGHDLNKKPFAIAAIKSKRLTLEGPIELIQGGVAILGRYPVFLPNAKTGEDEFWGFTTALIELSKLLEAVDIHGLISKNYHFELSRFDSETGQNVAFSKSRNNILENPISVEIQIPNGKWMLSIVPKAGWHSYYYLTLEGLLVLFSCGALSFFAYRHFCKTNELQIQRNEYEIIFNSAPALIIYKDDQNNLLRVNKAVADSLGLKVSQIEGRHSKEFFLDHYEEYHSDDLEVINSGKPKLGIVEPYRLKSGHTGWVRTDKVPYYNKNGDIKGILLFAIDITKQKEVENELRQYKESLENSLQEKELLLMEVHHRTKNNMQIISSLLWLQSKNIKEEKYLQMFQDCSGRISSMALIHEQLYKSTDVSKINFQEYLTSLGRYTFKSFGITPDKIQLTIESNNIFLDLDSGIPCGLLIQELISNSIKHGFPDEKQGKISISLRSLGERELELIVGDNGVGFPKGLDFRDTSSLGLSLVTTLAEKQLGGTITLNNDQGTKFKIIFCNKINNFG